MADILAWLRSGTQVPNFEERQIAADEIARLKGEVESYKRALVFCEDRIANCAGELANLRATNERLVRALRDFLICADGEAEDGDIPKKALWNVREAARAALTATQEKRNGE